MVTKNKVELLPKDLFVATASAFLVGCIAAVGCYRLLTGQPFIYDYFILGDAFGVNYNKNADVYSVYAFIVIFSIGFVGFCGALRYLNESYYSKYRQISDSIFSSLTTENLYSLFLYTLFVCLSSLTSRYYFGIANVEISAPVFGVLLVCFSLFFSRRRILFVQFPLVFIGIALLFERYTWRETDIHYAPSTTLCVLVAFIILGTLFSFVRDVKNGKRIALSTCFFLLFVFFFPEGRVFILDEYHLGEIFTSYHQLFSMDKTAYIEYAPTKGLHHTLIGYVNKIVYGGGYVTIGMAYWLTLFLISMPVLAVLARYANRFVLVVLIFIGVIIDPNYLPILLILPVLAWVDREDHFLFLNLSFLLLMLYYFYYSTFAVPLAFALSPLIVARVVSIWAARRRPSATQGLFFAANLLIVLWYLPFILESLSYILENAKHNLAYWGNSGKESRLLSSNSWVVVFAVTLIFLVSKHLRLTSTSAPWVVFFLLYPLLLIGYFEGRADGFFPRAQAYSLFSISLFLLLINGVKLEIPSKAKLGLNILGVAALLLAKPTVLSGLEARANILLHNPSLNSKVIPASLARTENSSIPNLGDGFADPSRLNEVETEYRLISTLDQNQSFLIIGSFGTARYSIFDRSIPTLSHSLLNVPSLQRQHVELEYMHDQNVTIARVSEGILRYPVFYSYLLKQGFILTEFGRYKYLISKGHFAAIKNELGLMEFDWMVDGYSKSDFGSLAYLWGTALPAERNTLRKLDIQFETTGFNDVVESDSSYLRSGPDPYLVMELKHTPDEKSLDAKAEHIPDLLSFTLNASTKTSVFHGALYWHQQGGHFTEEQSLKFLARNGVIVLPVSLSSIFARQGIPELIRLDIDAEDGVEIKITNLEMFTFKAPE